MISKRWKRCLLGILGLTVLGGCQSATGPGGSPLTHTMKDINGNDVELSAYKGKVVLIVNVASKCGFTPQYAELEALYQKHKDKGFVILGFPANNFMSQEPGANEEIKAFCSATYNVTFDMFSKISVKGDDMAPVYRDLTSPEKNGAFSGEIKWNFTKFLVARDGRVVERFGSSTSPSDPAVVSAIERELAQDG